MTSFFKLRCIHERQDLQTIASLRSADVRIAILMPNKLRVLVSRLLELFMEDDEFLDKIQGKIQRLTQKRIELRVDHEDANQLMVELEGEVPLVILGSNVLHFSGFARMCVEYVVESIRQHRPLDLLEFHLLLARN